MDTRVVAALAIVGALAVWGSWYLGRAFLLWKRLHGNRIVTCPQNGQPASVHIDLAKAITSDGGSACPPLDGCSRWSEPAMCDQPCADVAQALASSASALVKQWAHGRQCTACGGRLIESRMAGHHIALLEPTGMTREWVDVASDRLPLALATSLPLCWNCHVAATFRRLHPELVTDREERIVHPRRS